MRIFISTSSFGEHNREPLAQLEAKGIQYQMNAAGRTLSAEEIRLNIQNVDGLIAGTEPLTRDVLSGAPRLRAISRCGTGLDNVDLVAARELGIEVRNTPEAHVDAVAELTLAAILATLRHLVVSDRTIRKGQWQKRMGRLLRGKTIGLVGLGKVGRRLIELLTPFEVALIATDPRRDSGITEEYGVRYLELNELLSTADVISLHLPYSVELHHLLDSKRLRLLRPEAILVNCARGGIVDEDALLEILRSGRLAGVYMDTFEREPYVGPLVGLDNVTLSPHIGSYAVEGRVQMEREAVENLIDCLDRR